MRAVGFVLLLVAGSAGAWSDAPNYSCGSHLCVPGQRMDAGCGEYTRNFNSIVLPEPSATAKARLKHLMVCVVVGAAAASAIYVAADVATDEGMESDAWQRWRVAAAYNTFHEPGCHNREALLQWINTAEERCTGKDGDNCRMVQRTMPAGCRALSEAYRGLGYDHLVLDFEPQTFHRVMPEVGRVSLNRWVDPSNPPSAQRVNQWFAEAMPLFRKSKEQHQGHTR